MKENFKLCFLLTFSISVYISMFFWTYMVIYAYLGADWKPESILFLGRIGRYFCQAQREMIKIWKLVWNDSRFLHLISKHWKLGFELLFLYCV